MFAPYVVGTPTTAAILATDGTDITLSVPAGVRDGDLLVAWLRCQGTDWPADWGMPEGWARIGPAFVPRAANGRVAGWYAHRVVTAAGEPTSYTFAGYGGTGSRRQAAMLIIRNAGDLVGASAAYRGTDTTDGHAVAEHALSALTAPALTLVAFSAEFSLNVTHVPSSYPAAWTHEVITVYPTPDPARASRTYTFIGSRALSVDATVAPSAEIVWPSYSGGSAAGEAVTFAGGPGGLAVDTGGGVARAYVSDGSGGVAFPDEVTAIGPGWASVAEMLATPGFTWAHRGNSNRWAEMTLRTYTQAALRGYAGMECSLARTSDGVWFGLHDATLNRTSQVTGLPPATEMTWAQVQEYQVTNSADGLDQPYMLFEDLMRAYGSSHVIICDPKVSLAYLDEIADLCLAGIGADRCILKGHVSGGSLIGDAAAARGMASWGYAYPSDLASTSWLANPWTMLGMEWSASQADWDVVLADGRPVVGHVVYTQAAYATAISKGASGVQCGATEIIAAVR